MKKLLTVYFLMLISFYSEAQNVAKINNTIPQLQKEFSYVKGRFAIVPKLTVIDFWATWCAPCIAAFPELNRLQKKYKSDVQIIAASDENVSVLKNFLPRYKIDFTVAADERKKAFSYFDVKGRPMTVLLSPKNEFIWVGEAEELDTVISSYLLGKMISTKHIDGHPIYGKYSANKMQRQEQEDLFKISINRATKDDQYFVRTQKDVTAPANIKYQKASVLEIIQDLTNTLPTRMHILNKTLDTTYINVEVKSKSPELTYKAVIPYLMLQLEALFSFSVTTQKENVVVNIIRSSDASKLTKQLNNTEGGGSIRNDNGTYKAIRITLSQLASFLESKYNQPIEAESTDHQKFDLEFRKQQNLEDIKQELKFKYGVSFATETKEVLFVTIK